VNDVLTNIDFAEIEDFSEDSAPEVGRRYMMFKILYGRGFVVGEQGAKVEVHVSFLSQTFSSKSVPLSADPLFQDTFLFDLSYEGHVLTDFSALVKLRAPINVVVLKVLPNGGKTVLSTKRIEWRTLLSTGSLSYPVEFKGLGT
jgi:hypothetical protein